MGKDARSRLFLVHAGEEDIYGQETRVYGCLGHRRPRRLATLESGDDPTFTHVAFAAGHVGWTARHVDTTCTKVMGPEPECVTRHVNAYDLRTGRARTAITTPSDVDGFALGTRGWVAWVTAPDEQGQRRVYGAAGPAVRLLDTGAIEPASVRVRGDDASWRRDGARRSAPLR